MNTLIIGAGGFVGPYLYEYLLNQNQKASRTFLPFEFEALESTEDCYLMDLNDIKSIEDVFRAVKPDEIYHLAAQASVALSWKEPEFTMEVNALGFVRLLEALRRLELSTRVLVVGSSEEYGSVKEDLNPINESMTLNPTNPYSISKLTQELFGKVYSKAYGMDILFVRAFNHIGPGQRDGFVVSDFAKKIVMIEKGILPPILQVGNLGAKRDFTDVRDIVQAYYMLMKSGKKAEVYNVGSNKVYQISVILEYMKEMSGVNFEIDIDESKFRPIDEPVIQCDNTKIKEHVGWEPKIDIKRTLADVLNHYRTIL